MRKLTMLAVLLVAMVATGAHAQTFSSGSTGADGALNITADTKLTLPPTGILNYTTITVASGYTLTFTKNAANTPVVLLATGDVLIDGAIALNGGGYTIDGVYDSRVPGPGGYAGGGAGAPGMGPGGGTPGDAAVRMGRWVGPLSLVPIIGGSGGADSGGGGAGAIVIASSGKITINGTINANGVALGGSGGAIRLVANRVESNGTLHALGCWTCGYWDGYNGQHGIIRIEAPTGQTAITNPSYINPFPVITVPNAETNPIAWRPDPTMLSIVSVAGQPVPPGSGSRTYAADILLPITMPDDIPVVVNASNIPLDTEITLGFLTGNQGTVTTARLAGTLAASTATLHMTGLNRGTGVITTFYVAAVFPVPSTGGGSAAAGPDAVAKVRLTARPGEPTRYAFLRGDGTEVDLARVPVELRTRFGR